MSQLDSMGSECRSSHGKSERPLDRAVDKPADEQRSLEAGHKRERCRPAARRKPLPDGRDSAGSQGEQAWAWQSRSFQPVTAATGPQSLESLTVATTILRQEHKPSTRTARSGSPAPQPDLTPTALRAPFSRPARADDPQLTRALLCLEHASRPSPSPKAQPHLLPLWQADSLPSTTPQALPLEPCISQRPPWCGCAAPQDVPGV